MGDDETACGAAARALIRTTDRATLEYVPGVAGVSDLRAALEGMPAEVGICLDCGHAVLNGLSPAEEARAAGERLIALHLHDSDEVSDHWIPGDRSIDWAALNGALIEIGFRGAWTFEAVRAADAEGALPAAIRSRAVADAWTADRFS